MRADLVVFDPATVADRATYEKPHQYAAGIRHVLVNGKMVLENGEDTGQLPGRVLRHHATESEPQIAPIAQIQTLLIRAICAICG
jgi:N-acyl-D-aspartate/D-glutamate deacylase